MNDGQTRAVSAWAPKGLTRNPVAIAFDWRGDLYIAESDRANNAVGDMRNLAKFGAGDDDLRATSVEDRRATIKRWIAQGHFPPDYFTRTEDRVRIVRDTDGDGTADWSGVFAGGFNDEVDGIGAGVLWLDGTVYYSCIPNLWALKPGADPAVAESRTALSSGYGVRWCFYGHDLHGLTLGPDGRIYFSLGDRGFNVTTREGVHLFGPNRGGVFRCWPDGSGLELFHQGLRNPQELAFNEYGDLFTGDNNCSGGDRARVVHVVEGGDSGWRQDIEYIVPSRGHWNREEVWKTWSEASGLVRPAWAVPPIGYVGAGPSGIALYPGTGESAEYDGCLFMVDFYGSGATVHSFRAAMDGATYTVADHREYFYGPTITDLAWGYDGRLYLSDWGGGWDPNPNGNVLVVENKSVREREPEAAAIAQVQSIFKDGFVHRSVAELVGLLAHRDSRVRLAAQYELAKRPDGSLGLVTNTAQDAAAPRLQRVHAVWALGQISRRVPAGARGLIPLLGDPDAEIRAQAAKTLGDLGGEIPASAAPTLVDLLGDPSPRVRFQASVALGKIRHRPAIGPLLDLLSRNRDTDPVIRHGVAYALELINAPEELLERASGADAHARLGIVVALRRLGHRGVARFLQDADPSVAVEAARAVYDSRDAEILPALAALLDRPIPADRAVDALVRRAVEANALVGTDECVERLVRFAARSDAGSEWRVLALERVDGWDRILRYDGVWGTWADRPARSASARNGAVERWIRSVRDASADDGAVAGKAMLLEAKYALKLSVDQMLAQVGDAGVDSGYRAVVLDHLAQAARHRTAEACQAAFASGAAGELRARAEQLFTQVAPAEAPRYLADAVLRGALPDRQRSLELLGSINTAESHAALDELAGRVRSGLVGGSIALDLYEAAMKLPPGAAARRTAEQLADTEGRPPGFATPLLIAGGERANGQRTFFEHAGAQCQRCHTVDGRGGTAGPDLSTVGARLTREQLVESIVDPGATVAPGFGSATSMPAMTALLSPRETRDLVEYLASLRPAERRREPRAWTGDSRASADPSRAESAVFWLAWAGVPALLWASWRAASRAGG